MTGTSEPNANEGPIGLCGLGNMGPAVAKRLGGAGVVLAYDPNPERQELARLAGVEIARDIATIAARSRRIVLSLPSPEISRAVCAELLEHLVRGSLIVETSTVLPSDIVVLAGAAAQSGVSVVDAAILSGVAVTERGDGALLIGGTESAVVAAQPLLDAIAARQMRFAGIGSGMAAKVINNAVAHAVFVVLVEAAAMGVAVGIAPAALVELLSGDDAGLLRPLTHRIGERVLRRDYTGGMSTEAARKDSTLALAMAQQLGVPLFGTQAVHTVYDIATLDPVLARCDYAAIATLWEQWTGHRFDER